MTIRNRHELGIMIANSFQHAEGHPVAILAMQDGTAPKYTAYAVGRLAPATDTRTPIVNLFQDASERNINSSNRDVYCSYVPTTACFGIMRMSRARAVYFIQNNLLCRVVIGQLQPVPTAADAVGLPNERLAANVNSTQGACVNWFQGAAAAVQATAAAWINGITVPVGVNDTAKAVTSAITMPGPLQGVDHVDAFTLAGPATTLQAVRPGYRDELFMSLVRLLASITWTGSESVGQAQVDLRLATGARVLEPGKNISALLVANGTRIIGWGINTNDDNGTRHAETNAIQAYQQNNGTALPAGVRLYTSLQPCYMCAGLYSHAGGADCLYDQTDPGMVGTAVAATEQAYIAPFVPFKPALSFGQALNNSNALQPGIRAPDYLRTPAAAGLYSFAIQRFVTLGMKAHNIGEKQLWAQCLAFLKAGPLGPVMQRPDLFLID